MSTETQRASQDLVAKHLREEATKEFAEWWVAKGGKESYYGTRTELALKAWLASRGIED